MIDQSNLKQVLLHLGFIENANVLSKNFTEIDASLKADFNTQKLIYPIDEGFTISGKFTTSFNQKENFVVFECVYRLFEKGYKPQHIELEQSYSKIKKDDGGGRADIIVKDNNNNTLLIIECKTYGAEFEKHWKKTELDGDQLFRYLVNKRETKYLCLYSSGFINDRVLPKYHLITHPSR